VSEQTAIEAAAHPASGIEAAFAAAAAEGRIAVVPFLTVGYPNLTATRELVKAIVRGGADVIELGIPFSDPLADGATIQRASQAALDQGVSLSDAIALVRILREEDGITTPFVFMGYTNPFFQYGLDRLAATAAEVGVDGFIVPDLPTEESDPWVAALRAQDRDLIFLLSPTSTARRIDEVAKRASGFVYCVSLTGVTGAREQLSDELPAYIARVRSATELPLAIGFGISTPAHVQGVAALADGAIVASALINHLDTVPAERQAEEAELFVRALRDATARPEAQR